MRRALIWLLGLTPSLALAGPELPVQWSPDARWFAYTVALPADRVLPEPGWIFGPVVPPPATAAPGSPRRYRLYVADALSGGAILLEDGSAPLTSPAWNADGHALAFGRWVEGGPGPARFEVVIQDGLKQQRVLLTRPVVAGPGAAEGLPRRTLAWSPDGRYLAVPDPTATGGLLVVRADNGRVLNTIEGACWPSWSPDATRLAMIVVKDTSSLVVLETSFGARRVLADLGRTFQPPTWSRDSRSLLAISRRVTERGFGRSRQVEVVRVHLESGHHETAAPIAADAPGRDKVVRGVAFTADRDLEDVFSSVDYEGQPAAVVWYRPRTMETVHRFNPLDEISVRVGALALSPDSKVLAVRMGPDDAGATLGLWDVGTRRFDLLESDDASRVAWLTLLVESAGKLLGVCLPRPTVGGRAIERPTVLPLPGEIPQGQEIALRIRRLGRHGRSLCDRPPGSEGADPRLDEFLAEARLFFDILSEDYASALAALEALEARTTLPDRRVRLLGVRAQILLGLGDFERAGDVVGYLRSLESRVPSRLEVTPAGAVLVEEPSPTHGWARYLAQRLDDRTRSRRSPAVGEDEPPGNREFEGPRVPQHFGPVFGPALRPFPGDPGFPRARNGAFIDPAPAGEEPPEIRVRFRQRARPRPPR